jgi:hypothetical protein
VAAQDKKAEKQQQVELDKQSVDSMANAEETKRTLASVDTCTGEQNHQQQAAKPDEDVSFASHTPSCGVDGVVHSNGGPSPSTQCTASAGAGFGTWAAERPLGASGGTAATPSASGCNQDAGAEHSMRARDGVHVRRPAGRSFVPNRCASSRASGHFGLFFQTCMPMQVQG